MSDLQWPVVVVGRGRRLMEAGPYADPGFQEEGFAFVDDHTRRPSGEAVARQLSCDPCRQSADPGEAPEASESEAVECTALSDATGWSFCLLSPC